MDAELIRLLKERHQFDVWKNSNRLPHSLLLWKLSLSGREIPGYTVLQHRVVNILGMPRYFQSTWQRAGGTAEDLFNLDIYECDSRAKAREFLMVALSNFHAAEIKQAENAVGDVAFESPAGGAIVFARANIVASIKRAGRTELPLRDVAVHLDRLFLGALPTASQLPRVALFRAKQALGSTAAKAPVEIQRVDSGQDHVWYRFSSDTGEIELEAGHPVYKGGDRETHKLNVEGYRIDGNTDAQQVQMQ